MKGITRMKLETAYRKLFKHRFRWLITTRFDDDNRPVIAASLRDEALWPDCVLSFSRDFELWARGLANSMQAAAEEIELRNKIIDKHLELKLLVRRVKQ